MKNWKQIILSLGVLLFHFSVSSGQVKAENRTEAANKQLLLHIVEELFNKGDTTIADKYFVAEFAIEEKEFTKLIRKAFPDLRITADILVADKDIVGARWIATGTHKGTFLGVAPTNKSVSWKGSWFWTFKNGIVTDGMGKGSWDALGLIKQLQSK
jgi:predicted ester cyclase